MSERSTIVALLTPPGRGALATVAVRGPRAVEFVQKCLTREVPQSGEPRPWLRNFRSGEQLVEELVVTFPAVDEARVNCHGGLAASAALIFAIVNQGAQQVTAKEWLRFETSDPLIAAARQRLPSALTERTALLLLDQCHGALSQEVRSIAELLSAGQGAEACQRITALLKRAPLGGHLTEPWRIVLAGRPNAGKSSLLNALLGYKRSITSATPGTTRDVVTAFTAFAGWPVELRDTAGLRDSLDQLETAGVELARREIADADLVVLLTPADEALTQPDRAFADAIADQRGTAPIIHVRSKSDRAQQPFPEHELAVSALTGAGLERLAQRIADLLVPEPPPAQSALPFTSSQVDALQAILALAQQQNFAVAAELLRRQFTGNS